MNPVSGEQHERAVEAIDPSGSAYGLSPLALGQIIERYNAALAEQGVRLVEQPKCPACDGAGVRSDQAGTVGGCGTCPRCNGTGYVRLVDLTEAQRDTLNVFMGDREHPDWREYIAENLDGPTPGRRP